MNRLASEKAAYLRHAAHQKIDWYPWCREAFERAQREDRPVYLSSGGIWCHWCHVMAAECFEDEEVVLLLNENFISIKIDRDERPDVDRRYQQAIAAMGSGGGWPLNVFLTPEGKPFYGGTYFPPEDRYGRPGFRRVLRSVAEFYRTKRDDVAVFSEKLLEALRQQNNTSAEVNEEMPAEQEKTVLSFFDPQNGGFGKAPKFHMPGAIEFLMHRSFLGSSPYTLHAVRKTLLAMAKGGYHDHVGGGFHRYSVDESWIVPHFEKMADDNSWLLRNYADAYALFNDPYFREVAEGIIRFVRNTLTDPEGGFYASQDCDVSPDDEGGYFTWTDGDFRRILDEEEYRIGSLHFLHPRGAMHHDESKRVLFVSIEAEEISRITGLDVTGVMEVLGRVKEKLRIEREKRERPFVDRSIYTSFNGMLGTAFLKAYRVLGDVEVRDVALRAIERIWTERFTGGELYHAEGVKGLLDDYIHFIEAAAAAYEATGRAEYLDRATLLMEHCIERFWDQEAGGFFDTSEEVVGMRIKGIEDIPHPSPNSIGVLLLLKLAALTGSERYTAHALDALRAFALRAKEFGIHASYYYCALQGYLFPLTLKVHAGPESGLAQEARSYSRPYVQILYADDQGVVVPCGKAACYEPVRRREDLRAFLEGFKAGR